MPHAQVTLRPGLVATLLLAAMMVLTPYRAQAGGDWNDAGIDWQAHDAGLAAAKASGKPVCLVVYTEWCPHCTNYAKVFHDPGVVERAKKFVMIRIDKDKNAELSKKYSPDGEYIPRTYFLASSGKLQTSITAPRDKYRYFYNEHDAASLLGGMERALTALAKGAAS